MRTAMCFHTKKETSSSKSTESSSVETASRTALIAYAQQFLGNPYVYGGTSLTKGADCSGFVMSVFSHFGISTGRSSRDQAARGKTIPVSEVKPGDLLFYASGSYINHVGIYVGNGKIIHSSTPATGICYTPSNYRTPCKAVTFFDWFWSKVHNHITKCVRKSIWKWGAKTGSPNCFMKF